MTKWIRLSNRVPAVDEEVLVYERWGKTSWSMSIAYLGDDGVFYSSEDSIILEDVVCWMPLPAPPEGEQM